MAEDRKQELLVRVYLVLVAFVILSIVIMARVVKVSLVEGDKWRQKGDKNVELRTIKAERGNIYAEDFNLLSTSLQFFEIRMDLTVVKDAVFSENIDSLSICLSKSIGTHKSPSEWRNDLVKARRDKKRYHLISRKISADQMMEVKRFPIFRLGKYRGGMIVEKFSRRSKPYNDFASRTIGLDRENADKIGLEGSFDKFLAGDSIKVLMKKVSEVDNKWVPIQDMENFQPPRGKDVLTTINIDIQDIVHNELKNRVEELQAESGVAIVMEVKTGAIKAISNISKLENGSYGEAYNNAIGRLSEPGSTFKLASVLSLFDDKFCDLESTVNLEGGKKKFSDRWMYDSEHHGKERVTLKYAFEHSSNVGIARLVNDHYNTKEGRVRFVDKLTQMGLSEVSGVEVSGEPNPYIKHPTKDSKEWYGTTIPWMAHGYELMLTPLQMLNLYNTVANDGRMMRPYLVSDILQDRDIVLHFEPKVLREQIASADAIDYAQLLLKSVVQNGTGKQLKSQIVEIAGKTGTTRVNYNTDDVKKEYNASFAGYFPVDNPKYSMLVIVYKPQGGVYYGASAAGPVFKRIAERVTTLTDNLIYTSNTDYSDKVELPESNSGYSPDFKKVFTYVGLDFKEKGKANWVEVDPFETKMLLDKKEIMKSVVPNVKGMGARDAIYILENLGLNVAVDGVGRVVNQTLTPGSKIQGQDITIYLN